MATRLDVTELDFDTIKANLKTFLKQQDQFTDYDFEGSGMSVLLDLLAYNTHYNAVYANMLANEMFLDSADLKNSIVSHAKHVGYTPVSATSATANIKITFNAATASSLTVNEGTAFTTSVNNVTYQYIIRDAVTVTPVDGVYTLTTDIREGTLATNKYTVDTSDANQRYLIENNLADVNTLTVSVQNSSTDSTTTTYTKASDLGAVTATSKVYYLEQAEDGKYEVIFGDGVLGNKLSDGNIISLEYIVCNGPDSNGATTFSASSTVGGESNITIVTNSNSAGGSNPETVESIRFNAPRQFSAQNRAVTPEDYKTIIKTLYPNTQTISVWGGEDNDPPVYGNVYVSLKPISGVTLTDTAKTNLQTQLKDYSVGSVRVQFSDPEITYITYRTTARYNSKVTTKSVDDIKTLINNTISNYSSTNLEKFDGMFRYSRFIDAIDDTDASVLSNTTTIKIHKFFTPTTGSAQTYTINFSNALYNPHSGHRSDSNGILSSTGFKVAGDTTNEYFLNDDGSGNVRLYYISGGVNVYTNNTLGTIDYATGKITLNNISISSVSNVDGAASTQIRIIVQPDSNDVVPVRAQLLEIDQVNSGVTVTADDFDGTGASAGVNYTTTSSYTSTTSY
tara:strand:+ start:1607 stop:3475 length:1869 start_codon:yes stop_codon:yes gene_type:complete